VPLGVQVVPGAVHIEDPLLVLQQGRPGPPQLPQVPAWQMPSPKPTHVVPAFMQMPETQQPPPLQPLPSQHVMPGVPQVGLALPSGPPDTPSSAVIDPSLTFPATSPTDALAS
jgi:hypothetical protein